MAQSKRILRLPQVENKSGYKHSTIYEMIKAGTFPAPISMGARAVGWLESEVDDWITSRIDASRSNIKKSIMMPLAKGNRS